MRTLCQEIDGLRVPENSLAVFWLGQAGLLLKTSDGRKIAVDPYLSDCCDRYFGFKRLMPRMIDARELHVDLLICSHAHYDHFDVDSVPELLADGAKLICAKDCAVECERLNVRKSQITYLAAGETAEACGVTVRGVPCDHGALAPDALGLVIELEGKKIYATGDTCHREDYFANPGLADADLLFLPINGAYGNLNEREAARACAALRPRLAVPCHFWNFAVHGGNPALFEAAMGELAPDVPFRVMPMGGSVII